MNDNKMTDNNHEKRVSDIKTEIRHIWNEPDALVGNIEKNTFMNYCREWKDGKSIGTLFREANSVFFPLLYSNHLYDILDELLIIDKKEYVNMLSECFFPYILYDYFIHKKGSDNLLNLLLDILLEAPECVDLSIKPSFDVMQGEIKNVLAPTIMSIIGWDIIGFKGIDGDSSKIKYVESAVNSLSNRKDGFFLSYHYVRYLIWKSNYSNKESIQKYVDFISALTEPFKESAEKQFCLADGIRYIELNNRKITEPEKAMDSYVTKGIISETKEKKNSDSIDVDLLLNYRTIRWFLSDKKYASVMLDTFMQMFAYDSLSFVTNDFNERLVYYEVTELFLNQDDPICAWKKVHKCMNAMKYRLSSRYHVDKTIEMISCIRFMWNVNIVLFINLYGENKDTSAKEFWNIIWNDGLDYIRRYSRYSGTEVEEYMSRLICFYFVCFIRNGVNTPVEEEGQNNEREIRLKPSRPYKKGTDEQIKRDELINQWVNELMFVFGQIEEMPIIVLRTAMLLLSNGLRWEVMLQGSNGDFFKSEFMRAEKISNGQRIYDWVGKFLRKRGFQIGSD